MKKTLALLGFFGLLAAPVSAFFDENIDDIIANANSEAVTGVVATAGNGNVILFWDTKTSEAGDEAVKYRIDYGTKSVAEGLATEYDLSRETPDAVPSDKISDLANGTDYFFTVTAIFADETESVPSTEIKATPIGEITENILSAPVVSSAVATDANLIEVTFSEEVLLPEESPEAAFFVINEESGESVTITTAVQMEDEKEKVLLETENPMEEGVEYNVTASADITDLEGNPIESGSTDSATFTGVAEQEHEAAPSEFVAEESSDEGNENTEEPVAEEKDETPPEDVTDFVAKFQQRVTDFLVTLNWTASENSAGDLDYHILYRSENDGEKWDNGRVVAANKTQTSVAEQPETDITYKLTVKDTSGNESVGVIRSISLPALPETGSSVAFLAGLALFGAAGRRLLKK